MLTGICHRIISSNKNTENNDDIDYDSNGDNNSNDNNRKWQDYVYIQCEYKSTKQKIKHLLREGKIR